MADASSRTAGENFSPLTNPVETSSSTLAVLVPAPVLMLPAPDDRRLVLAIIDETVVDLAQVAALEHRRHRFLQKTRARIYVRAHIIDMEPARREILVNRLRERFGGLKCARWGVADRATHELLLKIASPKMIKETKYQHHRKLTEAKEAGVEPSERAYLKWVDAEKESKRNRKTGQQQQPVAGNLYAGQEEPEQSEDSAADTAGVPGGKIRFQRLVDELAFTGLMPAANDAVVRIQTPHQERFPEKVGVMIFVEADDRFTGRTREVHQLGLITGYDALADAIQAYLKERKAYGRTSRILHQRQANSFLRKVQAYRARTEGFVAPEPELPPYTLEEIDMERDENLRLIMQASNAAHAKEQAPDGLTSEPPSNATLNGAAEAPEAGGTDAMTSVTASATGTAADAEGDAGEIDYFARLKEDV